MRVFYDQKKNHLVYIGKIADSKYWDQHWENLFVETLEIGKNNPFIIDTLTKYNIKKNDKILEGGCGPSQNVYSMKLHGYDVIGVDYAPKTVINVKKLMPDLDVILGDVRKLNFPDNHFKVYWSIGVIEHFFEGYSQIANEMSRVVMDGGFLFLTFPYMSPIRKIKSLMHIYPNFNGDKKFFYQYALNEKKVINDFEELGFEIIEKRPLSGIKGFKDEFLILKPILQRIYDYHGSNILVNGTKLVLEKILSLFTAHTILLVFKNKKVAL